MLRNLSTALFAATLLASAAANATGKLVTLGPSSSASPVGHPPIGQGNGPEESVLEQPAIDL
jgi:hypothetical protein